MQFTCENYECDNPSTKKTQVPDPRCDLRSLISVRVCNDCYEIAKQLRKDRRQRVALLQTNPSVPERIR